MKYRWLKAGSLKKEENAREGKIHDKKTNELQKLQVSKTNCKRNVNMMMAISNSDLCVLEIPVGLMSSVYYVTKL
jgi:hypothetical protein